MPVQGVDLTGLSQAAGLHVKTLLRYFGDMREGIEGQEWVSSGYGRRLLAACELTDGLPVHAFSFLMQKLLFGASFVLPSETVTAGMYRYLCPRNGADWIAEQDGGLDDRSIILICVVR